ncbi:MAG: helix-hairpin-helix domain-containing protein [Pseudomonadota bacterium]
MLLAAKFDFARLMPTETESAFEYWMSLSPAAPMFGVRWRMADVMFGETAAAPAPTPAPAAPAPAPKARKKADPKPVEATVSEPAPAPVETPVAAAAEAPKAEEPADVDDLTAIKGIGPKMAGALEAEGITSFRQIADWSPEDVGPLESKIGSLPGRILRDDWIGQARSLMG